MNLLSRALLITQGAWTGNVGWKLLDCTITLEWANSLVPCCTHKTTNIPPHGHVLTNGRDSTLNEGSLLACFVCFCVGESMHLADVQRRGRSFSQFGFMARAKTGGGVLVIAGVPQGAQGVLRGQRRSVQLTRVGWPGEPGLGLC